MTRTRSRPRSAPAVHIRPVKAKDLDALAELECRVFRTDQLSRRSFRRLSASKSAALLVAAHEERLVGYALLLFRRGGGVARLYSIAVAPEWAGQGIGSALLTAAESFAAKRGCSAVRLEAATDNPVIALYRRSGYREIGRACGYYEDGGDALRFEKRLSARR